MPSDLPIRSVALMLAIAACIISTVSAASLGIDWTEAPAISDNLFSRVSLSPDASRVFSGGNQILVRSWDSSVHWGGAPGYIAEMSTDSRSLVTAFGNAVTLYDRNGQQCWTRNMNGDVRAVAVSANGSLVIAADNNGNYHSWTPLGDYIAMNRTADVVKHLAIAPTEDYLVATTTTGLRYYSPSLTPLWTDRQEVSLDEYTLISADGGTVISGGGTRLSSHTRSGTLTWQDPDLTKAAINDVACNEDCSIIITGSQDNIVRGIDRYGKVHWEFDAGQWVNAVASSATGSVIAAGTGDGTLYILDHSGSLLTKRKFEGRIEPRSLAVSSDGRKVVAADRKALYGLYLTGMDGDTSDTIYVAAQTTSSTPTTTIPSPTPPLEVTIAEELRTQETTVPLPTHQSPVSMEVFLAALAGATGVVIRRKL